MEELRVGIIGCGRPRGTEGGTGFGMSHFHARGYLAAPAIRLVAVADINLDNARAFAAEHGAEQVYGDYREMLARERLAVVSICTWPGLHAEMVVAAAEAGVRAVHCEKPMAPTWAEAVRMERACRERGAQLTLNHQRRFSPQFRRARALLAEGAIGRLVRVEGTCANLFDWGTHWFDMFHFYNDETPAGWVLGQVEPRDGKVVFGVAMEGQGLSLVGFANGVQGVLLTGPGVGEGTLTRLVGTEGVIEAAAGEAPLRLLGGNRRGWEEVPVEGDASLGVTVAAGVADLLDALRAGREPELSGARALRATELIFATYESSRRRGRVDLPLGDVPPPFFREAAGHGA